jgi:hypothetical protein
MQLPASIQFLEVSPLTQHIPVQIEYSQRNQRDPKIIRREVRNLGGELTMSVLGTQIICKGCGQRHFNQSLTMAMVVDHTICNLYT